MPREQARRRIFQTKWILDGVPVGPDDDRTENGEAAPRDVITIIGPDGRPQLIPAHEEPWWEKLEREAKSIADAFDFEAGENKKAPIKIKTFEA
jgi:hypothetical protein